MAHALMHADLPDVTDAHRRAAFEGLRMVGWTFEAAMANDTRRRVIEARAHQVRTSEWKATRTRTERHTPAFNPHTGHWTTRHTPGEWVSREPDLFN